MGIQDHNVYIELEELEFIDEGREHLDRSDRSSSVSLDLQYHWNILYR